MESDPEVEVHPKVLQEQPPKLVLDVFNNILELIAASGWYILIVAIACVILRPRVQRYIDEWQKEREERAEAAMHHKNPELAEIRELAVKVARQRLQMSHDQQAQLAAEKAKEREFLKRQEKLANLGDRDGGYQLNQTQSSNKGNSKNKPDYNPLMGAGSSGGFRPTRRSCPGGGCG